MDFHLYQFTIQTIHKIKSKLNFQSWNYFKLAYRKTSTQDPSGTLEKPENRDPSGTLEKPENQDPGHYWDSSETLEKTGKRGP